MNETYIQTIRGGIQHVIYLAKDYWTETPNTFGHYYHHERYGYINGAILHTLILDACSWSGTYMNWEVYAWLCYENRYLTIEQMAEKMLECGSYSKFKESLSQTFWMKYGTELHHTVAQVFIDVDGTEYEAR